MSDEYRCRVANDQICSECLFDQEFCLTAGERLDLMHGSWVKQLIVPEEEQSQLLEKILARTNERKRIRMKVKGNISHEDVRKLFWHAEDDVWHGQFVESFKNKEKDNLKLLIAYTYQKYSPLIRSVVTNPTHQQVDQCSSEEMQSIVMERLFKNQFRSILQFEARDNATFFTFMKKIIYNNFMTCLQKWTANKEYATDVLEDTVSVEDLDEKFMREGSENAIQEEINIIKKQVAQFYCESMQDIADKDFGDGVILYLHFAGNTNKQIGEILKVTAKDKANNITITMTRHDLKRRFLLLFKGKLRRELQLEICDLDMDELYKRDGLEDIISALKTKLGDQYIEKFSAAIRLCLEDVDGQFQVIEPIKRFPSINELDAPPREIAERVERIDTIIIDKLISFLELLPEKMKKYSKIKFVHSVPLGVADTLWSEMITPVMKQQY